MVRLWKKFKCRHSCIRQEYQSIACELAIIGVAHLSLPKIISLNIDVHIIGSRFPLDGNPPSSTPFEVVTCVIFIEALHKLTWNYLVSSIWNLSAHSTWIPKKNSWNRATILFLQSKIGVWKLPFVSMNDLNRDLIVIPNMCVCVCVCGESHPLHCELVILLRHISITIWISETCR